MRYIIATLVVLLAACPAWAERRVALVMGADGYESIRRLDNAVADALAMKQALEGLDFEVFLETDRDLRRMRRALEDFAYDAEGADVALVFFAGHGVEIGGENRLLPVDASGETPEALKASSLPLEEVRETVAKVGKIGLIVLDACRDDPFAGASGKDGRGGTALSKPALPATVRPGLGRMGRSENVLYAFAAAPGETAADGGGENSPFTTALVKYLGTDGLEIRSVLTLVQQEVYDFSRGKQLPYVESGLPKTFFAATTSGELPERERLLLAMADVTPAKRSIVEQIAAEKGVPLAPLYAALLSHDPVGQDDEVIRLRTAADDFARTRDALRSLSGGDPEVTRLRNQAYRQFALGAVEAARDLLRQAASVDRQSRLALEANLVARTLSEAATYYFSASAGRYKSRREAVLSDLRESIALFGSVESENLDARNRTLFASTLNMHAEYILFFNPSGFARKNEITEILENLERQRQLFSAESPQWLVDLSYNHQLAGQAHFRIEENDLAEKEFELSVRLAEAGVQNSQPKALGRLAGARLELAFLRQFRKPDLAIGVLRGATDAAETALEHRQLQWDQIGKVSLAYSWLADELANAGNFAEAAGASRRGITFMTMLLERYGGDYNAQAIEFERHKLVSHLTEANDLQSAAAEAVRILLRSMGDTGASARWHAFHQLGEIALKGGQPHVAIPAFEQALRQAETGRDPWKRPADPQFVSKATLGLVHALLLAGRAADTPSALEAGKKLVASDPDRLAEFENWVHMDIAFSRTFRDAGIRADLATALEEAGRRSSDPFWLGQAAYIQARMETGSGR